MMASPLASVLLWTTALSSGLMAGIYFAFSGFIMKSFGTLETRYSVVAMNAINETILRSWFMPLFFGSTITSIFLILLSIFNWREAGSMTGLIAGMVYLIGMFVCTTVFNVPLNNALAALHPDSVDAQRVWSHYLKRWTTWNHLRTVSSLLTSVLCIWLLNHQ